MTDKTLVGGTRLSLSAVVRQAGAACACLLLVLAEGSSHCGSGQTLQDWNGPTCLEHYGTMIRNGQLERQLGI